MAPNLYTIVRTKDLSFYPHGCCSSKSLPSVSDRGRPFANAANSYIEFPVCKSQKFGHWANIRPLLEKAKKLTICIGNSDPLRTFLLKKS
jgi:hypothetical protein